MSIACTRSSQERIGAVASHSETEQSDEFLIKRIAAGDQRAETRVAEGPLRSCDRIGRTIAMVGIGRRQRMARRAVVDHHRAQRPPTEPAGGSRAELRIAQPP